MSENENKPPRKWKNEPVNTELSSCGDALGCVVEVVACRVRYSGFNPSPSQLFILSSGKMVVRKKTNSLLN